MPIPIPILQGLKLLDQLPAPRLEELSRTLSERRVQRREVVVKLGDAGGGLGLLIEGRLQTVSFTLDGKEVGTDFVDAGDFFGELSVIDGQPAPEYVIAVAPSRVAMLDRDRARELMFSTPAGAAAVAARLAERLRRSATHKAVLALPSSFQRVCAQLAALARPAGSDGGLRVHVAPTHQEIAIMVNTSRETVTRTLQFLLGLQVVAREGHDLIVLRPELLRQAVDGSFGPTR
ncbi:MAG TPA: Crp/Fnr family transcriptional regulator [Rubrivivax sp.]|jgi:CRP-like cAMP-binding protein|nr:Crp/Fnr family transcriptional regulator [Rhodoferax sp.]MCL4739087.1 Crp/Fnr family transcriptional regulator [Burkholderiaceae bacterium]MCP5289718.1 Crp/Fnr family transcriptional regulator [Burkholderiaceae bacterium]HMR70741.1 Crp/Fnr family transcriptional regulator [Rubrivivax sp.]